MDRMATPRPPSTLGRLVDFAYTRRPGFRDRALAIVGVLEFDDEVLSNLGFFLAPVLDVPLGLQNLRDAGLKVRVRHGHGIVERGVGVPDSREHVRDRISHCHVECFFLTVVSLA